MPGPTPKGHQNFYACLSIECRGTHARQRRVEGASIASSPIAAEQADRPDGRSEQFGVNGSGKPYDAGVGQSDFQLSGGTRIENGYGQEGGGWGTVAGGRGLRRGFLRTAWGRFGRLPEAALPGVEGHRADAQSPAELGDREVALLLALDLAAPPFTPCLASCRRSESEHELSPGAAKLDSGIEAIMRAKAGRAVRLLVNRPGNRPSHEGAAEQLDLAILLCRQAGFRRVYLR